MDKHASELTERALKVGVGGVGLVAAPAHLHSSEAVDWPWLLPLVRTEAPSGHLRSSLKDTGVFLLCE